jgi:hypothetical protein
MVSCLQENFYLEHKFYDLLISWIHKKMSKICPKFLNLNASIYCSNLDSFITKLTMGSQGQQFI